MAIVQQVLIDGIIKYIDNLILKGRVKLNGSFVPYSIFKTVIEGNVIRKYIYLDTETGVVEEAQLLGENGDVLAIKPFNITKKDDGLVLAFEFTIMVREG